MKECNIECEHCQKYNDDWCVCWHPDYKGSRKPLSVPCLIDIDPVAELEGGSANE